MTMTIQRGESSRAFKGGSPSQKHAEKSDAAEDKVPITCHLCNVTCANNRHFKNHMNGAMHARCMQEVQQKSSVQVAMLLAQDGSNMLSSHLSLGKPASRWCSMCKEYFTCNVVEHRRSQMHKKAKNLTRPYCTICRWNTRSVRKFVEHMSSEEHRQRAQLVSRETPSPGPTEELITVDAVGCYEDGDEEDEEEDEED
uniref:C2H2-type domain-containing protein n=1 Tax=Petromyzon marinus TaxID=7757 RepID=S4RTK3_PETMA